MYKILQKALEIYGNTCIIVINNSSRSIYNEIISEDFFENLLIFKDFQKNTQKQ